MWIIFWLFSVFFAYLVRFRPVCCYWEALAAHYWGFPAWNASTFEDTGVGLGILETGESLLRFMLYISDLSTGNSSVAASFALSELIFSLSEPIDRFDSCFTFWLSLVYCSWSLLFPMWSASSLKASLSAVAWALGCCSPTPLTFRAGFFFYCGSSLTPICLSS